MKETYQGNHKGQAGQGESMEMHFENGFMYPYKQTGILSTVQYYAATIYSDEYIGQVQGSEARIMYNENEQVGVFVESENGCRFCWNNREVDRNVAILAHVLLPDREYLLYSSNTDFFCYLIIPEDDPRQNHPEKITNTHFNATYRVLDKLLAQANPHVFKCMAADWSKI